MNDFFESVKRAIEDKTVAGFLERWRADPRITLAIAASPMRITRRAFCSSVSGRDSLEYIYGLSACLHREVAFAGVIDERRKLISEFVRGATGVHGLCDWNAGDLLQRVAARAKISGGKICLGHTHPKKYGAICSRVYWSRQDLERSADKMLQQVLKKGLYKNYGGDYAEMFLWSRQKNFSRYFLILSPKERQIGIFETQKKGLVVYHPWQIAEE